MATINGISVGIDGDLSGFNRAIADMSKRLDGLEKDLSSLSGGVAKFDNALGGVKDALLGFASIDFALNIGKQILETTTEFQKLQAVLSNTLGSQEQGAIAFAKISDFAAKTNFSVLELTDTFTKLANRGVKASNENLQGLADVANSLGKPLEGLTEAILDVSNTERWNELGIKVSKAGDMITASFKEQTVSAKATEQGALDLVTAISKFEGVAGSTDAISKTLGGSISNLGDTIDNLFFTIGNGVSGPGQTFINFFSEALKGATKLLTSNEELARQSALKELGRDAESFNKEIEEQAKLFTDAGFSADEARKKAEKFLAQDAQNQVAKYSAQITDLQGRLEKVNKLYDESTLKAVGLPNSTGDELKVQIEQATGQLKLFQQRIDIINKTGAFKVKVPVETADPNAKKLQEQIAKILADVQSKLTSSAVQARIFGEEQGLLAKQTGILESGIRSLTDLGLTPQSQAVQQLVNQYKSLGATDLSRLKKQLEDVKTLTPKGIVDNQSGVRTLDASAFNLSPTKSPDESAGDLFERTGAQIQKTIEDTQPQVDAFYEGIYRGTEVFQELQGNVAEFAESASAAIKGFVSDSIAGFGEFLGKALTTGASFKDFGKVLLGSLGDLAIQVGKMAIATGIAVSGIKKALMSLNPYVAIAAGVALVALGTAVKGALSNAGSGIGSGGAAQISTGFNGASGTSGNVSSPANVSTSAVNVQGSTLAELRLSGELILVDRNGALLGVLQKQTYKLNKTSG